MVGAGGEGGEAMDLPQISGVIAGAISIVVGIVVIAWPRIIAVVIGVYLIAIGVIALVNGLS